MWKTIWNLVHKHADLLSEAHSEAVAMLSLDREMFVVVQNSLGQNLSDELLDEIRKKDLELNEAQQDIRRKVFEHLVVAREGDALVSGLVLTSIVIDLERIGDYSKNIGELVQAFPGRLGFGEYKEFVHEMGQATIELFDLARKALEEQSESAAHECMNKHSALAKRCDDLLERVMAAAKTDDTVGKSELAIVLVLRYLKRVSAHLKNIASATVAPFPMIGYRVENGRKASDDSSE
ncbi:MAG: hypothetical protein GY835_10905 [bacterium]|nr:hypothetical protein [bacterium]